MNFLHTLFYFLIAISVLVAFHEFGHFWVARRAGIKVLRFSLGFGKVLWSYQKTPDDTEYVVSAIPLGGYVKMVDEREGEVLPQDLAFAFNRQPLLARTLVVAAGPVFNLLLAVLLFWAVLVIGETGMRPILGEISKGTLAAQAGFVEGEEIISVNDSATPTWAEAISSIVNAALNDERDIAIEVKNIDDRRTVRFLSLSEEDAENPQALYDHLGFKPWSPKLKPIIGKVLPNSAALAAGLRQNDLIISADDVPIQDWEQWVAVIKTHAEQPIKLLIERDGARLQVSITPKAVQVAEKTEGKIGAGVHVPEELIKSLTTEYALSPLDAIPVAFKTTYLYSMTTVKMMGKMIIGQASVKNLSGPISIAQYAGQSADMGLTHFFKFLALISVSLGVLNLLPIPVLDGGHLLFFAVEGIKGSPVSEKVQLLFQQAGMALLLTLMVLVMVLDVQRLFE